MVRTVAIATESVDNHMSLSPCIFKLKFLKFSTLKSLKTTLNDTLGLNAVMLIGFRS